MADGLRLDTSALVALVMQALCYGVYLALFFASLYVLIHKRRKSETFNYVFLVAAIAMFFLITAELALSWSRVLEAFIWSPLGPIPFLGNLSNWKEVSRTAVYAALTVVADSLFIYRLYIVWSRNRLIIIVPILLLLASATSGTGICVEIASLSGGTAVFATAIADWATTFFTISLVQNLVTTGLIVYRIWSVNVSVARVGSQSSLWPVIAVVLESGAIYSCNLFVLLMTYVSGSFAQYIALDMLTPVIGITFSLIIVRVGLGLTKSATGHNQASAALSAPKFQLRKININVSQQVEVDNEADVEAYAGERATGDSDVGTDDTYDKPRSLTYSDSKHSIRQ